MERFFWICLAGAVGTGARYLIALWAAQRFGSAFPVGTLIVNLTGCFTIAAVMHGRADALVVTDAALSHRDRFHRRADHVFKLQLRDHSVARGRLAARPH